MLTEDVDTLEAIEGLEDGLKLLVEHTTARVESGQVLHTDVKRYRTQRMNL